MISCRKKFEIQILKKLTSEKYYKHFFKKIFTHIYFSNSHINFEVTVSLI